MNELNEVIRRVNRGLVSASTRGGIERAVCKHLADSDLFAAAFAADVPTWCGDAERWTVGGESDDTPALPEDIADVEMPFDESERPAVATATNERRGGRWTLVPIVYGRTLYGVLALFSRWEPLMDGGTIADREREVLGELGELIGHAVDAVENRRLLAAEAVIELELQIADDGDPLVRAAAETGASLEVTGVVHGGEADRAYVAVEDAETEAVADALGAASSSTVQTVGAGAEGFLEWPVGGDTLVGALLSHGANIQAVFVEDGIARATVELPSDGDVRALLGRLHESFPDTRLEARRERDRPARRADSLPEDRLDDLTERQQQALEVAYRAGYFEWPRESTAEEVAERLGISSATFHYHLRRSEETLLAGLFDADGGDDAE